MFWTKEKIWELQYMYSNPEYSVKEMAEYFGVSIASIRSAVAKNFMIRGSYKDLGLKKCWKCKELFPANTKYFHMNKSKKDKLNQCCKKCHIENSNNSRKNKKG